MASAGPSLLNETAEGCPFPLLPWTLLRSSRFQHTYELGRMCYRGCCLPCDYRLVIYANVRQLFSLLMILGIISTSVCIFLIVSQMLSRKFVKSEFNLLQALALAICNISLSFFYIQRHRVVCEDEITPAVGLANGRCMAQGLMFVFGFQCTTLAVLARIISLHISVVWNKTISLYILVLIVVLISAAFTGASVAYLKFAAGLFCSPTYPELQYIVYIPTLIYTGSATILQTITAVYIIRKIYRIRATVLAARMDLNLEEKQHTLWTKITLYSQCALTYLSIGWRIVVFTEFMALIAICYSIVFFGSFNSTKVKLYNDALDGYLRCVADGEVLSVCASLYQNPLGNRVNLIWSNVLMASTFVLLLTEVRPFLFQGWYLIVKNPKSILSQKRRNQLFDDVREVNINPIRYYRFRSVASGTDTTMKPSPVIGPGIELDFASFQANASRSVDGNDVELETGHRAGQIVPKDERTSETESLRETSISTFDRAEHQTESSMLMIQMESIRNEPLRELRFSMTPRSRRSQRSKSHSATPPCGRPS
ncbi:hypothetical protein V1512DRAFT_264847 [Lipomyces arxii]|uniref:uncharacterized protein n=1 Tax=Lipomyces arxii TaxID=56418 RepID=UPI0034CF0ADF